MSYSSHKVTGHMHATFIQLNDANITKTSQDSPEYSQTTV